MSGAAAHLPLLARSVLALGAVLVLLFAARAFLTRHGLGIVKSTGRASSLRVAETLHLDARHRLVLVRRDEGELLLAIGPQGISRLDLGEARAVSRASDALPVP